MPAPRIVLAIASLAFFAAFSPTAVAQPVEFEPGAWDLSAARLVETLGRQALMGTAFLNGADFANGVIEVDVAILGDRVRSYPGVIFRAREGGAWERFYLRPHRHSLYGDALQYVPAWNGVDSWQLYNGFGFTAPGAIPHDRWFHVRIEVAGTQARVFLDDAPTPALVIPRLLHGEGRGGLGLMGPMDGTACFSNFSYRADDALVFDPPPPVDDVPGVIRSWSLSKPFPALRVDAEQTPEEQGLADLAWREVTADPGGLVDIARTHPRSGQPDLVYARAVLTAERDEAMKLDLGYSDLVSVFVNGELLYVGDSRYQSRDSSFLGAIGYFDSIVLPLRKGKNELLLAVTEVMGGWGFEARDGRAVFAAPGVTEVWATPRDLLIPESAAWDPARRCVYVSNYDATNRSRAQGLQALSRVSADGAVTDGAWLSGLKNPLGVSVSGDRLVVVEEGGVVEVDIPSAGVTARYAVEGAAMLNDVAIAPDGALYVSDTMKGAIYRIAAGATEEWLAGPELAGINGVRVIAGKLIVGTNGDNRVKSIDLATKAITRIADLGPGIIDGIDGDAAGNILVSHNRGRLWRISPEGEVVKLLDTTVRGVPIADFSFAPGENLVIFPSFTDGRVLAYRIPTSTPTTK